jgi:hypothetical protein
MKQFEHVKKLNNKIQYVLNFHIKTIKNLRLKDNIKYN